MHHYILCCMYYPEIIGATLMVLYFYLFHFRCSEYQHSSVNIIVLIEMLP